MVIGLQESGGEYTTLQTLDVATKTFSPERIPAVFGGVVAWLPDGSSFVYTPDNSADPKDPKAAIDTRARLHRPGASPQTDLEVLSRTNNPDLNIRPEQIPDLSFSNDGSQLYGRLGSVDWRMDVWLARPADLSKPKIDWKRLVAPTDSVRSFVKLGNRLFLHSIRNAPNGQILTTDAGDPNAATATVLLPESKQIITDLVTAKDFLFVTLSDGINQTIRQYEPRTNLWSDVPIPMLGTTGLTPYEASHSNEMRTYVNSWNNPGMMYDYDPQTHQLAVSIFHTPMNYPGVADLVVEELEIPSYDGTMVPLSLVYRKGLKKDGTAACLMTGYGAYGVSATPYFSRQNLALMNRGVVLAVLAPD